MTLETTSLPENLAAAHAMILTERAARLAAEARARDAEAEGSGSNPSILLTTDLRLGIEGGRATARTLLEAEGFTVLQTVGPAETFRLRWREDAPGTWLYCQPPVFVSPISLIQSSSSLPTVQL